MRLPLTTKRISLSGALLLALLGLCLPFWLMAGEDSGDPQGPVEEDRPAPAPEPTEPTKAAPPAPAQSQSIPAAEEDYAKMEAERDQAFLRYEKEALGYQQEIARILKKRYEGDTAKFNKSYEKRMAELDKEEARLNKIVVQKLEHFVTRFPHDSRYTPEAMFRLAEIYYWEARERFYETDEFEKKNTEYQRQLALYDAQQLDKEPVRPHPDYSKSISLYETILQEFPEYRLVDASCYALATCYREASDYNSVRRVLDTLLTLRPDSQYAPDALYGIGEAYFQEYRYEEALPYLEKAAKYPQADVYAKALYFLGWTYFIINRFDDTVTTFTLVCDESEKTKKKTGQDSPFKPESVRYIAYCFAQDDSLWPGRTGEANAEAYFDGITPRPWESEVFYQLGDNYVELKRRKEAIAAYRRAMRLDPWNLRNAELQANIVDFLVDPLKYKWSDPDANQPDMEKIYGEQERLAKDYGEGSEWARRNSGKPEVKKAATLARTSLKQWAKNQHSEAQKANKANDKTKALAYYRKAAGGYRDFLKRFPDDEDAYELRYLMANALYFAGDHDKAVVEFIAVRDTADHKEHYEESAKMVVYCYASLITAQRGEPKDLSEDEIKKQEQERLAREIKPIPLPELLANYIQAVTFYMSAYSDPAAEEEAVRMAWTAGEYNFDHDQFEAAREWYMRIVNSYPKNLYAVKAARRIIFTYRIAKDWVKVAEWSEKLATMDLGPQEEMKKLRADFKEVKGGAMVEYAKDLQARGEFEKAAESYLKAVENDPKSEYAASLLYNAAVNYGKANRPMKAMEIFERLVNDYPNTDFAAEALWWMAESAWKAYNFEKASEAYQRLYQKYQNVDPQRKCDALYNHAVVNEFDHNYKEAARLYEKFSNDCDKVTGTASQALFRAADCWEKAQDWTNMTRVYDSFAQRFGANKETRILIIKAYYKILTSHKTRNMTREITKDYERILNYYNANSELQGDINADQYAAEAEFNLFEPKYEIYRKQAITGRNQQEIQASFIAKETKMLEMVTAYNNMKHYKSPEYYVAMSYRAAEAVLLYAEAIMASPFPREALEFGEEGKMIYREKLELEVARPIFEQAAAAFYKLWTQVKERYLFGYIWTKKLMEAMNNPYILPFIPEPIVFRKKERTTFHEDMSVPIPLDSGREHVPLKPPTTEPEKPAEGSTPPAEGQPPSEGAPPPAGNPETPAPNPPPG